MKGFIASEGLGGPSLPECTESVDSLSLRLREGDTRRVRAAVGLLEA